MPLSLPCLRSGAKIRARSPLSQPHSSSTSSATPSAPSSPSASTNYLRYLSHLAPSHCPDLPPYWLLTTTCLLYLRRGALNTPDHDALLAALFRPHFDPLRLAPTPTSPLGHALTRNGYFLAAYAYLLTRTRNSPALLQYLALAYRSFRLKIGGEELRRVLEVEVEEGKAEERSESGSEYSSSTTVKRSHWK